MDKWWDSIKQQNQLFTWEDIKLYIYNDRNPPLEKLQILDELVSVRALATESNKTEEKSLGIYWWVVKSFLLLLLTLMKFYCLIISFESLKSTVSEWNSSNITQKLQFNIATISDRNEGKSAILTIWPFSTFSPLNNIF